MHPAAHHTMNSMATGGARAPLVLLFTTHTLAALAQPQPTGLSTLSWLATAPPTRAHCSHQRACPGCIAAGCGWCVSTQRCVPDQLGVCDGGPEEHIGFVAGQQEGPRHWMCDSDDLAPGPVTEAAGECLAMAQLGGLHRPLSVGCVRVETNGWLQIYTRTKEKRGWQKRWCELQQGFVVACGKTPLGPLRPRIDLAECESLAPSHVDGAKQGELALSCASGLKRIHGVTADGQKRWVRALITVLTVVRCQAALQSEALSPALAEREDTTDKGKDLAAYARLSATGVRYLP